MKFEILVKLAVLSIICPSFWKIKENLFLKRVNDLENEERKNQLKWQVKLGEELIDAQTREEILIARSKAEHAYHVIKTF